MAPVAHQAVLLGAGQRGRHVYGAYASRHPDRLRFVAVAEPDRQRRRIFSEEHGIAHGHRFRDWAEALDAQLASICVIATPDRLHAAPAIAALDQGMHVLLEKPAAHTIQDCRLVLEAARASAGTLTIGHVLRYTPFFSTLNRFAASGRLGRLVHIEHREDLAYWHMAHSFVRGNWGRASSATPMIVQKCCHDFDIIAWNLATSPEGGRVTRIQSFGSLVHFIPEEAPDGAMSRCTAPCPVSAACPYDARRLYLNPDLKGWPVHAITDDLTLEGRMLALREGPYGRCVYQAGSDVVDHQTVAMETSTGATVLLVMNGHAARQARTARYHGTRGSLRATFGADSRIEFTDHLGGPTERIPIRTPRRGHGGGDNGLIESFLGSLETPSTTTRSAIEAWYESHLLAFAAEHARLLGGILDVDRMRSTEGLESEMSKNGSD